MKSDESLSNSIRATRTRLGLSQQQLAEAAAVARQTISGIEGGLYSASTSVALRLARALGCTVEELFWLDEQRPAIEAELAGADSNAGVTATGADPSRVVVARVRGRWVAHTLNADSAFRSELIPSDGTVERRVAGRCHVRLLDDQDTVARTVLVAGCAPALSLWARSAERWHPGLRVHWLHANSTEALAMLKRGDVHAAGLHLDGKGESGNIASVRTALPDDSVSLVNLGEWNEGLLLASGNPRGIAAIGDLPGARLHIVNREPGAGARMLLEAALTDAGIQPESVKGWNDTATSHEAVARAVAAGTADAGMSTELMAALFGLDFLPVRKVRYDVAVLTQDLAEPHIRELFATLDHRWVRSQLRLLGGFDTSRTGDMTRV